MMFSHCLREIFESLKKDSFLIDRGFLWASYWAFPDKTVHDIPIAQNHLSTALALLLKCEQTMFKE